MGIKPYTLQKPAILAHLLNHLYNTLYLSFRVYFHVSSQTSLSVPISSSMPGQELAFLYTTTALRVIKLYLNSISPESLERPKRNLSGVCLVLTSSAGLEKAVRALWKILAQHRAGGGHSVGSWRKKRRSNVCATANMTRCQQKHHSFSQGVQSTLQTLTHETKQSQSNYYFIMPFR